jgi:hypothetical protein
LSSEIGQEGLDSENVRSFDLPRAEMFSLVEWNVIGVGAIGTSVLGQSGRQMATANYLKGCKLPFFSVILFEKSKCFHQILG